MTIQVLVAAMNQGDYSLLKKMNIQSNVIVGNQSSRNSIEEIDFNGYKAIYLNFKERGVGLNRNNALIRATGDICVFADEDLVYVNDYVNRIESWFKKIPEADALIFNILTLGDDQHRRNNKKVSRVRFYNSLNYGAVRIAVKRDVLLKKRICFSQLFGGGALYSSGEDTLFIHDMLKNGMKIYVVPETIASVDQTTSTWFSGYHEKFFHDKGALMKALFPHMYWLLDLIYFPFRFRSIAHHKIKDMQKWMFDGSHDYSIMKHEIHESPNTMN